VIIVFEVNAHRAVLPVNEANTEIGQWGPYVVAVMVFAAALTAKFKGWDFDKAQNHGFEWLLEGESTEKECGDESDESEDGRELLPPLPDVPRLGDSIDMDWDLRRYSQVL
jgi:hypothetical protein